MQTPALLYQSLAEPVMPPTLLPEFYAAGLTGQPEVPIAHFIRKRKLPNPNEFATISVEGLLENAAIIPLIQATDVITQDCVFPYQAKAEPIAPHLFAVSIVDAWFVRGPELLYPKKRVADFKALFFCPPEDTFTEQPPAPDLLAIQNALPDLSGFTISGTVTAQPLFSDTPALDHWHTQPPGPVRPRPPVAQYQQATQPLEPSLFTATQLDMWFVQAGEPVRKVKRLSGGLDDAEFILEPTLFEDPAFVELDKWFVRPPDPVRTKPYVTHTPTVDLAVLGAYIPTQLDQWFVQASEPFRKRPYVTHTMGYSLTEPTLVVSQNLAWIRPPEIPVRPRKRAAVGESVEPFTAAIPPPAAPDIAFVMPQTAPAKRLPAAVWAPHFFTVPWDDELLPDTPTGDWRVEVRSELTWQVIVWAELITDVEV